MKYRCHSAVVAILLMVLAGVCQAEVSYPAEAFKMLDTFEAHRLGKADKSFADKSYRQAVAEYDAFILEFPRSLATSYVLYRKARALQLDNKRYEAIKAYQEVLDYFPDDIAYAAAALYYTGLCHEQNGDLEKAMKAWAEMAADEEYSRVALAAAAINSLAANLEKQNRHEAAAKYYEQVAVDFRQSNREAAGDALDKLVQHYVRRQPNLDKLQELWDKCRGFHTRHPGHGYKAIADEAGPFWSQLIQEIQRRGQFDRFHQEQQQRFYTYWAAQFRGKFPNWDDFQLAQMNYQRLASGDNAAWLQQVHELYLSDPQRGGYHERIIKWIRLVSSDKNAVAKYYERCKFEEMTPDEVFTLIRVLIDEVKDMGMARNLFRRLPLDKLSDKWKYDAGEYLRHRDEDLTIALYDSIGKAEYAMHLKLRYYHWRRNTGAGLPLAKELTNSTEYSQDAWWKKAEMLQWSKKYDDAIRAYRMADNPPNNVERIADCHMESGNLDQAVAQLREIENFFPDIASRVALKVAGFYGQAGRRDQQIAALRHIMMRYPKSRESSTAHEQLQNFGVLNIGGGTDAN